METVFLSIFATLTGAVVGSWLTAQFTYGFQKKLLNQQLDFQKKTAEEDAKLRKEIFDEWHGVFTEFRNMVNTRAAQIVSRLDKTDHDPDHGAQG